MNVTEVQDDVFRIDLGVVNAYLCVEGDRLTLIDTGIATSADDIRAAIRERGWDPAQIEQIILTHHHDDHRGAAHDLASSSGGRVIAHANDAGVIRGKAEQTPPVITESERPFYDQIIPTIPAPLPCDVARELVDGDGIDLLGGARVFSMPGHTPGSIAIVLPERGLVFTGDAVATIDGKPILGVFNIDRAKARDSFRRLAALDFEVACVGHGDPIVRGAAGRLREICERWDARAAS